MRAMTFAIGVAASISLGLSPRAAFAEEALHCGGALVPVGASKLELLGKCGPPTFEEGHAETRESFQSDAHGQTAEAKQVTVQVELWTYDLGEAQFIRHVTLENGKIVAIAVGDYGHGHDRSQAKPPPAPLAGCDPVHGFSVGDAAEDVLARCGEPATREVKQLDVSRATRNDDGSVQGDTRSVQVEVWGYNFGAHQFIRLLQFRGGRLVKISTGGYGF